MRMLYSWVLLPAALGLALPTALFHRKLRGSLLARRGVWQRLQAAAPRRDPARPLVWFQVASAGELLQAEPVLRRFAEAGAQVAITMTSVSALRWRDRVAELPGLVWADVLPPDFPWAVRRLWRSLRPSLLVQVQSELWPGLVLELARLGTPQALLAARLREDSPRLRRTLLRSFYRPLYRSQASILALSEPDQQALAQLVPEHRGLDIGGDPGVETAVRRVRGIHSASPEVSQQPNELEQRTNPARGLPAGQGLPAGLPAGQGLPAAFSAPAASVLVAGSIWPADEEQLLPVLEAALGELPPFVSILAPHEPAPEHLERLERRLAPWGVARLSALTEPPDPQAAGNDLGKRKTRVLLVDTVGQLATLYALGTVAYVGGAFTSGVHNVAEPAAAGLPVYFGPRYRNASVATHLLQAGVAKTVNGAEDLRRGLWPLLIDTKAAAKAGAQAQAVVDELVGAAESAFHKLRQLLPGL